MSRTEEIYDLVITGKSKLVADAVTAAVEAGDDPKELLNQGMIAAMDEVGERFSKGEIYVPEMMVVANAMKKGVAVLKPYLTEEDSAGVGTVVIGTVAGDMHDIGKNLVAMMFETSGFDVIDLGVDVAVEDFIAAVKENSKASIVCLSALLTTTMAVMKEVIVALSESGLREQVKVLIGGAPVTQEFCDEIGADGYGQEAAGAVKLAKDFIVA
jgi:5-methyltetrahydrofolate--homocysteine methyltransferase